MNKNVGTTDRIIRFVAGAVIIGAGLYYQSWWGAIGLILILTGMLSSCPAYSLLKLSTGTKKQVSSK